MLPDRVAPVYRIELGPAVGDSIVEKQAARVIPDARSGNERLERFGRATEVNAPGVDMAGC